MEREITHQEENPKTLIERIERFKKEIKREKTDMYFKDTNPEKLIESILSIYEGVEGKSLSVAEFNELRRQINEFFNWASNKIPIS